MKQILLLLIGLLFSQTSVEAQLLSEKAQISLLTSSPYEGEVFTVYGHAALRLKDEPRKMDLVFNYGIFSFEKPNFIYRCAKGETDYMLGVMKYSDYIIPRLPARSASAFRSCRGTGTLKFSRCFPASDKGLCR